MQTLLYNKLKEITTVNNRIYPMLAPTGVEKPYIVYGMVNQDRDYTHDNYTDYKIDNFRISCYDTTYGGATLLSREVINLLESWVGSNNIQAVRLYSKIDNFDNETDLYMANLGFAISNNN